MNRVSLLASLFIRLSSVYAGGAHGGLLKDKKKRRSPKQESEDLLDKAPWRIDLIRRDSEKTDYRKVA